MKLIRACKEQMKITEVEARPPELIDELTALWERSVRATHHFLSAAAIDAIRPCVPQGVQGIARLAVLYSDEGRPQGFVGVEGDKAEMLFLEPQCRGEGLGRALLSFAIEQFGATRVDVNEQNPQARGFYEHMGFQVIGRSDLDGQGNPYPILHMKLSN